MFCDIPHSSLTRKPSTSSLPAAILLQERQGLTPSSSIDQLSLHGSSCSLDILGQTMGGGSVHHSESMSMEGVINNRIDCSIVETGPINDGTKRNITNDTGQTRVRNYRETIIRSKSSHGGNSNNCNSYNRNGLHAPSRSVDNTPSHSPLKVQRSLSPHQMSHFRMNQNQSEQIHERIHSMPEKSPNRSSLPCAPSTPQPPYHRKDIHSLPPNIGDSHDPLLYHHHHHAPKMPQVFISPNHLSNWSMTQAILHGTPVVLPSSAPIIRGRIPSGPVLPPGYQPTMNGIVQAPPIGLAHTRLHRLPSYPITTPHSVGGVVGGVAMGSNSLSCYNCGQVGHRGSTCLISKTDSSPVGGLFKIFTIFLSNFY